MSSGRRIRRPSENAVRRVARQLQLPNADTGSREQLLRQISAAALQNAQQAAPGMRDRPDDFVLPAGDAVYSAVGEYGTMQLDSDTDFMAAYIMTSAQEAALANSGWAIGRFVQDRPLRVLGVGSVGAVLWLWDIMGEAAQRVLRVVDGRLVFVRERDAVVALIDDLMDMRTIQRDYDALAIDGARIPVISADGLSSANAAPDATLLYIWRPEALRMTVFAQGEEPYTTATSGADAPAVPMTIDG